MDQVGNLYGTASGGTNSCGGFVCGVVFRLAPQPNGTWKYTMVCNFNEVSGGMSPFFGVILDGKGHMFGVTSSFGQYGFPNRATDYFLGKHPDVDTCRSNPGEYNQLQWQGVSRRCFCPA
jgi:hypothetical protein